MTKNEALKLALEVLKRIDEATPTAMAKLVIPEIQRVLAQPEHIGFMDSKLNPMQPTRNEVLEEVAKEIEKMTAFGGDTIASFTVYIRNMKT